MNNMNKMSVILSDFRPIILSPHLSQKDTIDYIAWLMATAKCVQNQITSEAEANKLFEEIHERVSHYAISSDKINQRQFNAMYEAITKAKEKDNPAMPEILKNILEDPTGTGLDKRMDLYRQMVLKIFKIAYKNVSEPPDDLIHASATGYMSPSPGQEFFSLNNWLNTTITHSYHMGCYGAFPALRMAVSFIGASYFTLAKPKKRIDIVHTELSSLHPDIASLSALSSGNIVVSTLFSDGFIKYSAYPMTEFERRKKRGLKVLALEECLIPKSLSDMSLDLKPNRFHVHLSVYVPALIKTAILQFMINLCNQVELDFQKSKKNLVFAIHPGGPKILDHVRDVLEIDESQIRYSREILYKNGNMVSATVPYIWNEIIKDDAIPVGTKVASMAFGPGLTCTGGLLEKV